MNRIRKKEKPFQLTILWIMGFMAAGIGMTVSCNGDETTGSQDPDVERIAITPETATIETGSQLDFSVAAITTTGDTVDQENLNIEWEWWSSDPYVFTVEAGGMATGQNPGEAYCIVEASIEVSHTLANDAPEVRFATLEMKRTDHRNGDVQDASVHLVPENRNMPGTKPVFLPVC